MTASATSHGLSRLVKDTVYLFFEPFFDAAILFKRKRRSFTTAGKAPDDAAFGLVLDLIAHNQASLIEYFFLASQKHKALRIAVTGKQKGAAKEAKAELMRYLNSRFFGELSANFQIMHRYFAGRAAVSPRLCVKGSFRTEDKDVLVTIFRDYEVPYDAPVQIGENTALDVSLRTGSHFISNDLVRDVASGDYHNPRINYARAKAILASALVSKREILSRRWPEIWRGGAGAYKSTMVVPITLSKSKLSEDFTGALGAADADKFIFGFLCLDHRDRDFFDERRDVAFAYAVADILSIYAFTRLQFTDFSKTYSIAEATMEDPDTVRIVSDAVNDAISRVRERAETDWWAEAEKTFNNVLVTDETLMDFVSRVRQEAATAAAG